MTPLQEAWKRVWGFRRSEGPEFESALFALVDAATAEGVAAGRRAEAEEARTKQGTVTPSVAHSAPK